MNTTKKILSFCKWLSLTVFLGLIILCVYLSFRWKAEFKYPQLNTDALMRTSVFLVFVPIIILTLLFLKVKKNWQTIAQIVLQALFGAGLPVLILGMVGFVPGVIWSSGTSEISNYYVLDGGVEEHIQMLGLDVLPTMLPQNINDVNYSYYYSNPIDNVVRIDTSWVYLDVDSYEKEKERLLQNALMDTYEENGYTVGKIKLDTGINEDNNAEFGYDDESKAIFYRIRGVW